GAEVTEPGHRLRDGSVEACPVSRQDSIEHALHLAVELHGVNAEDRAHALVDADCAALQIPVERTDRCGFESEIEARVARAGVRMPLGLHLAKQPRVL